jgi:hypothetical protein
MSPDDSRIKTAKALHADKNMPVADILKTLKISRPTLYRWLAIEKHVGYKAQRNGGDVSP